ncbi:hypothetical protein [Nocardiopsis sp. HUAS JQ3]|nr:hypothetical protein [Nocardiopsis sp. HUAS JQ3]WDZ92732.1 hypothetical protein PV789_09485 [Nocardiopsis sp. HUAS JQ3]
MAALGAAIAGDTATVVRAALVLASIGVVAGALACVRVGRGLGDLRG